MLNSEIIKDGLQNKNFVMLITSFVFMFGILTYFSSHEILFAFIISFILILLSVLKIFTLRRVLFLTFVFYVGFFVTSFKIKTTDNLLPLAPVNAKFEGRIVSVPNSNQKDKTKFFFEVAKINNDNISGKTMVTISASEDKLDILRVGDKISFEGSLRKPFYSTNPSQFDYSAYLKNFNVYTVLYCNNDKFEILQDKKSVKWRFMRFLNTERVKILNVHSKYLQSPNLEILGGIVFGDDAISPPEYIRKSFINSGLLHILAASGMNVAFIFGFWVWILARLRIGYKPRILSGMLVVIIYTLMTGLGPSVLRAAIMLLFVYAGKLIDRDAHSVSLLSLVAVLLLIYNPAYINNVSFQLSFVVTLGLLTTVNAVSEKFDKVSERIKSPVLIPVVAQIWVAPIQMFYFNTFSLYSVFANIICTVILSIISFMGFVSSILALVKPVADFVCMTFDFWLNYLLDILVKISDFFGNLPYCLIQTSHPEIYQMIIYYLAIAAITYFIKFSKYKHAILTAFCVGILLLGLNIHPVSKNLEVIAFDVGNADSFMIKTPKGEYFFIDTGKAPYQSGNSQAKIIMLKYLKDRGIRKVKGIIVSHFDSDHSGGASDFIENVKVENLYLNSRETHTSTAKNIFRTSKKLGQKITIVKNNELVYEEPDLKITNFKTDIDGKNSSNESSIITLLSYKDFEMLFTGDAGVEGFECIKKYLPRGVEILKVGHHGGPGVVNDEMLDYLQNDVSLISTGVNYFGHPNRGTLDILRHTDILRTDLLNSIKISTDGREYKIYSYDTHDKKYRLKSIYRAKK